MLTKKKTNRTLNEERGQETETQTHGVSLSLTGIGIALWRNWLRTQYDSFCIKHLDIDYAVHSAFYPTDESLSMKGYSSRNGKLTELELRLRMRSPLPILRQTSMMWCLHKDNIILYPHPRIETGALTICTGKFITMETEIVQGKIQEYLLSGQWKRMGHVPDKWRVLCQIFALS